MTDLPFDYEPAPANPAATPPKHRHVFVLDPVADDYRCSGCPERRTQAELEERRRRGRTNRNRGNAIERELVTGLGQRRTGQYGGPEDGRGLMFASQVKSGGAYPERLHRWLKAVPVAAGQTAILIVADAPGPGHRRRALVVVDYDDWKQLHGE